MSIDTLFQVLKFGKRSIAGEGQALCRRANFLDFANTSEQADRRHVNQRVLVIALPRAAYPTYSLLWTTSLRTTRTYVQSRWVWRYDPTSHHHRLALLMLLSRSFRLQEDTPSDHFLYSTVLERKVHYHVFELFFIKQEKLAALSFPFIRCCNFTG